MSGTVVKVRNPGRVAWSAAVAVVLVGCHSESPDTDPSPFPPCGLPRLPRTGRTFHIEPSGRRLATGAQPAELTIAGPASELYLLLWNRTGTEDVELSGDETVLDLWRARAKVTWS
ncbi:hypothetical protein Ais01nite_65410 [Asanoa ishikariensis]|uniref:hypothetical protein n=1 Tax=Asanoa ishikariensis TaxID=137265 RepID=UPI000B861906|nr:hypothetical protein [Asanoa ishikariensis]GIF68506.1 hypothetical protein Ais01nite_65410 [Asanoa ishikariensis]